MNGLRLAIVGIVVGAVGGVAVAVTPARPVTVDGVRLGEPVRVLLARPDFATPCDVDPIDKRTSRLYFWAGATGCREAPAFPEQTTLVVLTPWSERAAAPEQPIDLVAWFGGHRLDTRTSLQIRIGQREADVNALLGPPARRWAITDVVTPYVAEDRVIPLQAQSHGQVHVLLREGVVVGIAVGRMTGGTERERILTSGYAHHLRYTLRAARRR
jgi:hypothetical protein